MLVINRMFQTSHLSVTAVESSGKVVQGWKALVFILIDVCNSEKNLICRMLCTCPKSHMLTSQQTVEVAHEPTSTLLTLDVHVQA